MDWRQCESIEILSQHRQSIRKYWSLTKQNSVGTKEIDSDKISLSNELKISNLKPSRQPNFKAISWSMKISLFLNLDLLSELVLKFPDH